MFFEPQSHKGTKKHLPARVESLAKQIVDIAICIHKELGPGLLESVYAKCFCFELRKREISFQTEKHIDIYYQSELIDHNGLEIDLLIEDSIIIELKAQDNFHPVWEAQLISYLKLTQKRLGFLINFHVPLMKDGIKRIIL